MITLYKKPKLTGISWLLDRILLYVIAIILSTVLSIVLTPDYNNLTYEEWLELQ